MSLNLITVFVFAVAEWPDVAMETGDLSWTDAGKLDEYFPSLKKDEVVASPSPLEALLSDDLDLQQLMKEEIEQQHRFDQLQFDKQREEEELLKQQREQEILRQKREQEMLAAFELQAAQERQPQPLVYEPVVQEISYQDSQSPISHDVSSSSSPLFFSTDTEFEDLSANSSGGPCIISVPVSEAVTHQMRPSVQSSVPRFIIQYPSQESQEVPLEHPQRLVINVKKVSLSSKRSSPQLLLAPSPPTLKEALEGDEADDFIREMIHSPQEVKDDSIDSSSVSDSFGDDSLSSFSPASSIRSADSPQPEKAKGIRGNPYSSTEKKQRKKEQNKRAALRYRQKKKEEEGGVLAELRREEEIQRKLLAKYEAVRTELKLMKKLAREMLIAQGKLVE